MTGGAAARFMLAVFFGLALARPAVAHCDTTRGPVVTAGRAALAAGDVNLVLHWVRPEDEPAVRSAFQKTSEVRALGAGAKALADRYFFENLVRIHRAGEGAPYTGLTDSEPEPIISATDAALARGAADELEAQLVAAVRDGLTERFAATRTARNFRPGDVAAGREFVTAYVGLTHWVEGVFGAAKATGEHHVMLLGHDQAPAAVNHPPPRPVEPRSAPDANHGTGAPRLVPWILAGLAAIVALIEAVFLLRRSPTKRTKTVPSA